LSSPRALIPWNAEEAVSIGEAAFLARVSASTVRSWAVRYHIGRRIAGGAWKISAPALLMLLDDDHAALATYLAGERAAEPVASYFARAGVPLKSSEATKFAELADSARMVSTTR
jgi:hypothetical protein